MSDAIFVEPGASWSWSDKYGVQFAPIGPDMSRGGLFFPAARQFSTFYPQVTHAIVLLSRALQPGSTECNFRVERAQDEVAYRLCHRSVDFATAPTSRKALIRGLEAIARCVAYGTPWASPEILDALAHAYEVAVASEEHP